MNRHQRRRQAAQARRTGYLHRLIGGLPAFAPGTVNVATIQHDPDCGHYKRRQCDCIPDVSVRSIEGGDVTVVAPDGTVRKVRPS